MEKADLAVVIGRFQPVHLSHQHILQEAFNYAHHVVVLVGSTNCARDTKNPFTFEERKKMILDSVDDLERCHYTVLPLRDYHNQDSLWVAQVQEKVAGVLDEIVWATAEPEVVLVGNFSDSSSYYLGLFPQWKKIPVNGVSETHATAIRRNLFSSNISDFENVLLSVPREISEFLAKYRNNSPEWIDANAESIFEKKHSDMWKGTPYPVIFVTVDAVVTCLGHILVIKRKNHPGKGLYAIPGGYLKQDETLVDGAIRELKEETGIKIHKPVLKRCVVHNEAFDYPGRSRRGRIITHAYHIKLDGNELPEVKGGDDAAKAMWMPFAEVFKQENNFFEDHQHIIQKFITRG